MNYKQLAYSEIVTDSLGNYYSIDLVRDKFGKLVYQLSTSYELENSNTIVYTVYRTYYSLANAHRALSRIISFYEFEMKLESAGLNHE